MWIYNASSHSDTHSGRIEMEYNVAHHNYYCYYYYYYYYYYYSSHSSVIHPPPSCWHVDADNKRCICQSIITFDNPCVPSTLQFYNRSKSPQRTHTSQETQTPVLGVCEKGVFVERYHSVLGDWHQVVRQEWEPRSVPSSQQNHIYFVTWSVIINHVTILKVRHFGSEANLASDQARHKGVRRHAELIAKPVTMNNRACNCNVCLYGILHVMYFILGCQHIYNGP